ncbi:MAG: cadherin-like domain-containing protein [Leptolyngbyaceae cyanobacterium SM2_5_2]|nr:cadherin-like domain-containing protein [Leptolyngbyaceae cyanobacterium SM2_5_2]
MAFGGLPNDDIDDTAAIQQAIDSGATTVYLPNGFWKLNGTVELRNNVRRFTATEAVVFEDNSGNGVIKLVENGTQPTVVVERFETRDIAFVQDSTRTLVMSSLITKQYYNTPTGTGDLFIEDVSGGPWTFTNQNVWARQINPETVLNPRIKNDGGNLWILGYKTEDEGTLVETTNGGQTEVIGAYALNGEFGDIPAFISDNSSLSVVSASFRTFDVGSVPIGFQETRNGVTRTTTGLPGYYSGIANSDPVAVDDTATTTENTALILSPASLLANDSDVDGNTLFIMGLGDPINGSVALESDGNIRFTPNPDFTGIGSFTYMVGDGNGGGATATVTVTVQPEVTDPGDPGAWWVGCAISGRLPGLR